VAAWGSRGRTSPPFRRAVAGFRGSRGERPSPPLRAEGGSSSDGWDSWDGQGENYDLVVNARLVEAFRDVLGRHVPTAPHPSRLAEKESHLLRVPLSFELFRRRPSPYPLVIEPAQEPVAE